MKRLAQILTLSLMLSLVLLVPAQAEAEENSTLEVLPTAAVSAVETEATDSSDAAPVRPDPVFLAGSDAGGAGGADAGLVNGDASTAPRTHIMYEDHLCCPYGAYGCDCSYWPGRFCDPINCPYRQQPYC